MNDYLVAVHLYNCNSFTQRYIAKLPREIVNRLVKRAQFAITLAELHERIAPSEVHLPKETIDLERAPHTTFSPVTRMVNLKSSSVPVIVKVGQEHLQLITVSWWLMEGPFGSLFMIVFYY